MFGLKKKSEAPKRSKLVVAAPLSGKLIDLSSVNDAVFSKKMMGEGFAIKPENGQVVAPVAGTAITVFPTGHAVGIRTKDNVDVLVHIGLDTVNLKGEGFKALIQEGDEVRIGQPIVDFDQDVIEKNGFETTTMVVFTERFKRPIKVNPKQVKAGDVLIQA